MKSRALSHDEKKAAEAAFTGRPFNPAWSLSARVVYDDIVKALPAPVLSDQPSGADQLESVETRAADEPTVQDLQAPAASELSQPQAESDKPLDVPQPQMIRSRNGTTRTGRHYETIVGSRHCRGRSCSGGAAGRARAGRADGPPAPSGVFVGAATFVRLPRAAVVSAEIGAATLLPVRRRAKGRHRAVFADLAAARRTIAHHAAAF